MNSYSMKNHRPWLTDLVPWSPALQEALIQVVDYVYEQEVIDYEPGEREVLLSLGGHNRTGEIVHRFEGRPCWSGARYFILDDVGEAFRCYPARRKKVERMGNFLDPSFSLSDAPTACLYATCNCTVPIARDMMPR